MDTRPNLILLVADQFRGDCLGIDGHPDVKTPHLDSLAAEGVRFPNAYSACPSCVPARACLYTGMSQVHAGRVGVSGLPAPPGSLHALFPDGQLCAAPSAPECADSRMRR